VTVVITIVVVPDVVEAAGVPGISIYPKFVAHNDVVENACRSGGGLYLDPILAASVDRVVVDKTAQSGSSKLHTVITGI
jgi:hypothetical protein